MGEEEKKKWVIKISVLITSIFVIFLSVAYAFINVRLVGEKKQVITAGELSLELEEDENNIQLENALPMYDEVGMMQSPFTFRLINKGTNSANYTLKLVDITTGEKLSTDIVKYGLVRDNITNIRLLSKLKNQKIDSGRIEGQQVIEYSLRLWIDSKVSDHSLIYNKSLRYKIHVEVEQEKEISYVGMMRGRDLPEGDGDPLDTDFYMYRENITDIVFENQIEIPTNIGDDMRWDMSVNRDGSVMAYLEDTTDSNYILHLQGNGKIYANEMCAGLFLGFLNLTTIDGWEYFDTSYTENMYAMFANCSNLTHLDLSTFDTSKVTDISFMFYGCSNLISVDLSSFDTSNVTTMEAMFWICGSLINLDLGGFDVSKVANMRVMFYNCKNLTSINLNGFNTVSVTTMDSMFQYCSKLEGLDLRDFNTSNVENMSDMFYGCSRITSLDLSSFNTSKVRDMSGMFQSCIGLTMLDLSNFDTSNVTIMRWMFYYCNNLTSINLSSFDTSNVTDIRGMFSDCESLASLDISSFDVSKVTNSEFTFSKIPSDIEILVRDDTTKDWVLSVQKDLTNVVVKMV